MIAAALTERGAAADEHQRASWAWRPWIEPAGASLCISVRELVGNAGKQTQPIGVGNVLPGRKAQPESRRLSPASTRVA